MGAFSTRIVRATRSYVFCIRLSDSAGAPRKAAGSARQLGRLLPQHEIVTAWFSRVLRNQATASRGCHAVSESSVAGGRTHRTDSLSEDGANPVNAATRNQMDGSHECQVLYTARISESAVSREADSRLTNLVMMWQPLYKRITSSHHIVIPGGIKRFSYTPLLHQN